MVLPDTSAGFRRTGEAPNDPSLLAVTGMPCAERYTKTQNPRAHALSPSLPPSLHPASPLPLGGVILRVWGGVGDCPSPGKKSERCSAEGSLTNSGCPLSFHALTHLQHATCNGMRHDTFVQPTTRKLHATCNMDHMDHVGCPWQTQARWLVHRASLDEELGMARCRSQSCERPTG